ncbi:hypothetical protein TNCT_464291 [Trichonephila clavata]|uniref:Uncharacterized protein n=1 Tax=Trichonephila clavata TaxID=2740835 RepID=A0A8X6LBP3_TRICU|nr:hypothetical protein TNCT_464291 [Trichonephila clavata]
MGYDDRCYTIFMDEMLPEFLSDAPTGVRSHMLMKDEYESPQLSKCNVLSEKDRNHPDCQMPNYVKLLIESVFL